MSYVISYYVINVTCFRKQPPLLLNVSQIPQENTCVGVSDQKNCKPADRFHVSSRVIAKIMCVTRSSYTALFCVLWYCYFLKNILIIYKHV